LPIVAGVQHPKNLIIGITLLADLLDSIPNRIVLSASRGWVVTRIKTRAAVPSFRGTIVASPLLALALK